uniref:Uncharacterized protein LOC100179077 n=1 Tax=Phallusia mammillata TaxID=59560 RepID=A0A6F9DHQ0_9ASCI|nr:uncharacterized protein LOC100179077 [Phallusia mammillata]
MELLSGTQYLVNMTTIFPGNLEVISEPVLQQTKPNSVEGIQLTGVNNNSISLRWQLVLGAEFYQLEYIGTLITARGKRQAPVDPNIIEVLMGATATISDLESGTSYDIFIAAVNSGGQGAVTQLTVITGMKANNWVYV